MKKTLKNYKTAKITIEVSEILYNFLVDMCKDCECSMTDYIVGWLILPWAEKCIGTELPDSWRQDNMGPEKPDRSGWITSAQERRYAGSKMQP